jgi:hypothetical protein
MTKGKIMKHLDLDTTEGLTTSYEWLALGSQIGEVANEWAERSDLVASVSIEGGAGAPACFKPLIAEIEINSEIVFGKITTPDMVGDFRDRSTQYEFSKAMGAVIHEAFHARYSSMDLVALSKVLTPSQLKALSLLEEGRIEALGVDDEKRARVFLRSCAMEIIISESMTSLDKSEPSVDSASTLVALVHARVLSGVLNKSEVKPILDFVDSILSVEVTNKLVNLCAEFQTIDNTSTSSVNKMVDIAIEWDKIVSEVKEEKGESGESGELGDEGLAELSDILSDIADSVSISNSGELYDQETSEKWKEEAKAKEKSAKERITSKVTADQVFGKPSFTAENTDSFEKSTTVTDKVSPSGSRIVEVRNPTNQEKIASIIISKELEQARYRERDVVEVSTSIPAGRLNTRAMVQSMAQESKGVISTIQPWRKKVRKHTDEPQLRVGVLVDISGSMGSAMNPMATTAWIMSEATKRVQGKVAMVYFGNDVFPVLKSGQTLSEVNVYSATDSTEKFDRAFRAINGELDLLDSNGARLLVIVSDGAYPDDEVKKAKGWLKRCDDEGVSVLWLPFGSSRYADYICENTKAKVMASVADSVESAKVIGATASTLLSKVG